MYKQKQDESQKEVDEKNMESYQVVKRDGSRVPFEIQKIIAAIRKAFEAMDKHQHDSVLELLALRVTADFDGKIKDGCISVEYIQDSVERVLSQAGYADVAKAYILYRRQREKLRQTQSTLLDWVWRSFSRCRR